MKYLRRKRETERQDELAELYVKYKNQMSVFVNIHSKGTLIQRVGVVEDIVQDVFLEALKKYDSFKAHENPVGWLCQTAHYKIMEYERKLQKLNFEDVDELELVADDNENGYAELELKLALNAAMTEKERLRYCRFFLWGWSIEQIAEAEGTTVNNMRVKLSRLKKKLLEQVNVSVLIVMILTDLFKI